MQTVVRWEVVDVEEALGKLGVPLKVLQEAVQGSAGITQSIAYPLEGDRSGLYGLDFTAHPSHLRRRAGNHPVRRDAPDPIWPSCLSAARNSG